MNGKKRWNDNDLVEMIVYNEKVLETTKNKGIKQKIKGNKKKFHRRCVHKKMLKKLRRNSMKKFICFS